MMPDAVTPTGRLTSPDTDDSPGVPTRRAPPALVALDALETVDTTAAHLGRALHVQRSLAARSQRGRKIPDGVVAATAEGRRATVLHYDADFDLIASVTGQRCQWVVPAGSIP